MTLDDAVYEARIYHDKAVIKQIEEDLQVMVRAIIGNRELIIELVPEGYDRYPSCKHHLKQWCPTGVKYKLRGYLKPHGYTFYGNCNIEIYCKIISAIAGNHRYMPFSSVPLSSEVADKLEAILENQDNEDLAEND